MQLSLAVLAMALLLAGCGDDSSNGDPPIGGSGGEGASGAGAGGDGGGGAGGAAGQGGSSGAAGEGGTGAGGESGAGGSAGDGGASGDGGDGGTGAGECPAAGCGAHGECVAEGCLCELGYVAADCSDCASGYAPDGEDCVPVPAGDGTIDQWGTTEVDAVSQLIHVAAGVLLVGRTEGDLEGETSAGGPDFFIALRAPDSADNWTLQWGSNGIDEAKALAIGTGGEAFVAGNTTGEISEPNLGLEDAVLSKITTSHVIDWSVQWGTDRSDRVTGTAMIGGEVLVAGNTTGDLARANPSSNPLDADAFLTRVTAAGEIAWTTQWGATEHDIALGIAVDGDDNVYVVGATAGDIDLGEPEGGLDAFCTKLSASGVIEWTVQWGSTGDDYARAIAVLGSGNVVIAGSARGTLAGEGTGAMFITEIDSDGVLAWTRKFGAHGMDTAHAIAVGADGTLYIAGETMGDLVAGAHEGKSDAFMSKRAADGSELWTDQFGTAENDIAYTVALDDDDVYFGGKTSGSFPGFANEGGWPDNFIVAVEVP